MTTEEIRDKIASLEGTEALIEILRALLDHIEALEEEVRAPPIKMGMRK